MQDIFDTLQEFIFSRRLNKRKHVEVLVTLHYCAFVHFLYCFPFVIYIFFYFTYLRAGQNALTFVKKG